MKSNEPEGGSTPRLGGKRSMTLAGLTMVAFTAVAADFQLEPGGIGGGGGTSSGGSYSVTGSIGEIGAGRQAGGNFSLEGGSLAIFMVLQTAGAPELSLTKVGGNVVLSWSTGSTGFTLEQAGSLQAPVWATAVGTPVINGERYELILPMSGTSQFFRLKKTP